MSYREFKTAFGFGLLPGVGTLFMALTTTGGEVDVDVPILIIIGSTIGLLFSFRKGKTTQKWNSNMNHQRRDRTLVIRK